MSQMRKMYPLRSAGIRTPYFCLACGKQREPPQKKKRKEQKLKKQEGNPKKAAKLWGRRGSFPRAFSVAFFGHAAAVLGAAVHVGPIQHEVPDLHQPTAPCSHCHGQNSFQWVLLISLVVLYVFLLPSQWVPDPFKRIVLQGTQKETGRRPQFPIFRRPWFELF